MMEKLTEIVKRHLPKEKAEVLHTKADLNFELTPQKKAQREVDIFNSLDGDFKDYDCKKCKNKGVIYKSVCKENSFGEEEWEVVARECECMKLRGEINRINKSGIKKLLEKYTFDTYKAKEYWQISVMTQARKYADNPKRWFYIGGQAGCGKTHICTAIVGELIRKGRAAVYMLWQDEITTLKQNVNEGEKYNPLMERFKTADVLYIDDFFKVAHGSQVTAADVNMTFKIINYRYNNSLPTIISSELSIAQIVNIDEALGSRIAEMTENSEIFINSDKFKNYRFNINE